ncbi:MAG: hypothetical protein P9M04_02885 [Candidatus Orphnella occulta]|nr:hypothetical protein [Candidatus Orphnella occulta]
MKSSYNKQQIIAMQDMLYQEQKDHFDHLGEKGHYTDEQKKYAFKKISEYGVRVTSRILQIPCRTLQRWCRAYGILVKRCPYWVYEWAENRIVSTNG